MLIPAIIKKEEIEMQFKRYYYTDDMMYEVGGLYNWTPTISESDGNGFIRYAIVDDNDGKLLGYFGYRIDWYASCASQFGLFSFDRGNPTVGIDVLKEMRKLIHDYKLHRIEWRMVGGNPVEKHYDKFCDRYNGRKLVLHDAIKDRYGRYRNDVIYEIINDEERSGE